MNVFMCQRKPLLLYIKTHGVLQIQVASATLNHQSPQRMQWNYVGFSTGQGAATSVIIVTAGMPTSAQSVTQALTQKLSVANTAHPGPLAPQLALSHCGVGLGNLHLLSSDCPWLPGAPTSVVAGCTKCQL